RRLWQDKISAEQDYLQARQAMSEAEIAVQNARQKLSAFGTGAASGADLNRLELRAPFDGIVSERKVSNGDTAQVGKELIKVIDPSSMRFEGLVSADKIGEVKVGQPVLFRVNGYPGQNFSGKIKR
ncbi:efflux RND transporter periplasmic adaptor subunit, partial [Pseudomonas viridiflava]|uniref:efflux RND transporter periplasmic adaptor subunit n=1 Tax=Pseudomonas viridiflava TaxID=33069 RepID=UPI000F069FE5